MVSYNVHILKIYQQNRLKLNRKKVTFIENIKYVGIKLIRNVLNLYEENQKMCLMTRKEQMRSIFKVGKMLISQINLVM